MKNLYLLVLAMLVSFISSATIMPIVGDTAICPGSSRWFTDSTTGGTWSSSMPAVATIDTFTGVIWGVSPGTTTISYTVGAAYVTQVVTVPPIFMPSFYLTISAGTGSPAIDTYHAVITGLPPVPIFAWYLNGVVVPSANDSTFIDSLPLNPGDLLCFRLSGATTCGDSMSCITVAASPNTGIVDPFREITISPNPTQGRLLIKVYASEAETAATVRITDVTGQTVYDEVLPVRNGLIDGNIAIDERFGSGIYFVSLRTATQCVMRQVVLQR